MSSQDDFPIENSLTAPSESIEVAQAIHSRIAPRQQAPVRTAFIGAYDAARSADEAPPLAKLLRGGRGGEVRLKLELSFLWFAVKPPHDLVYPARVWAMLLGLEDPETRGSRRVRTALNALATENLIKIVPQPGRPSKIFLLDEGGEDIPYTLPGESYNKLRNSKDQWRHRYIQIPNELWTNGWITVLSGAALAMLLIIFSEVGNRDPQSTYVWFSPKRAKETYGISEDTRSKGLRELRTAGLIDARRKTASRDVLDFRRVRNTYKLNKSKINEQAAIPQDIQPPEPQSVHNGTVEDFLRTIRNARSN